MASLSRCIQILLFALLLTTSASVRAGTPTTSATAAAPVNEDPSPTGVLTLKDAVALALLHNPGLATFDFSVREAEAKQLQAGLLPNPTISLENEDLRFRDAPVVRSSSTTWQLDASGAPTIAHDRTADRGARAGLGDMQSTLRLSQLVELGGKRAKRVRMAEGAKALARWDYEAARLNTIVQTAKAFIQTMATQEQVALAKQSLEAAEDVLRVAGIRVAAGKSSPLDSAKSETDRTSARLALEKSRRDLETAREALAANWGAATAEFDRAEGPFDDVSAPPALEALERALADNPDVARWAEEMESREAALSNERAQRIPDLTVVLGYRMHWQPPDAQKTVSYDSAGGLSVNRAKANSDRSPEHLFTFEVDVPLPLFNHDQGNIAAAEYEVMRGAQARRQAETAARTAVRAARRTLAQTYESVQTLRNESTPRARDVFERMQEGYREGKFGYLDLLDARHTLFDLRGQYIQALSDCHNAAIDLDRLAGRPPQDSGAPAKATDTPKGDAHETR